MKNTIVTAFIAIIASGMSAHGMAADQHEGHAGHGAKQTQPGAGAPLVEGLVKKVDKQAGKVTIAHGPLPDGMPAMTMAFSVKNAGWLDQLKAGDKIRFMPEQINGAYTVVRLDRQK